MNLHQLNRALVYIAKEYPGEHPVLIDTGSMAEEGYEAVKIIAVEKTLTGSDIDIIVLWDDTVFETGLGVESRYEMGIRFIENAMQVVRRPEPMRGSFESVPEA